jgi:hypothetical protein
MTTVACRQDNVRVRKLRTVPDYRLKDEDDGSKGNIWSTERAFMSTTPQTTPGDRFMNHFRP